MRGGVFDVSYEWDGGGFVDVAGDGLFLLGTMDDGR